MPSEPASPTRDPAADGGGKTSRRKRRKPRQPGTAPPADAPPARCEPASTLPAEAPLKRRETRLVLAAFFLSGAAALVYEVTWTRMLSLVLGSTVYALSTMLATFMGGLALGAYLGGKLADRSSRRLGTLALVELGIGVAGAASIPLIYAIPEIYLPLYRAVHKQPTIFFMAQVGLCAVVMLGPTTLMGATFPFVTRLITTDLRELGRKVADAYSVNTCGAIIGSLSVGFVLIPLLGIKGSALAAAGLNATAGVLLFGLSRARPGKAVAGLGALALAAGGLAYRAEAGKNPVNFYTAARHELDSPQEDFLVGAGNPMQLVYERESAEGQVRAFRDPNGFLLLRVGGKLEGTNVEDLPNTLLLALLPIASHPAPASALVIGLGAGVTVAATRAHIRDTDLCEINPAVVEAVSLHGRPGLLEGVDIHLDDARSHLLKTDKRYDIISSEPSYPTEASVANLFTEEFYRLAAARLTAGGIFCQWLPYYLLANDDVTMMLKTFTAAFPHSFLWKVPEALDLIVVGSTAPFSFDAEQIRQRVAQLNAGGPKLDYVLSRTPADIARLVRDPAVPVNTDDRPRLEFRVTRTLVLNDLSERDRRAAEQ